jgi:ATP-binding cassette subfamily F protein uup
MPEVSLLKNICPEGDYVHFQGQYVFNRSYLERFLFNRHQMDLPVAKLSGGEQSRLRLAQLMLKEAQILILDEPTNDLDTQTLDVLEDSLKSFNGAVILVTHDRYFMDQVATDILAFDPQPDGSNKLLNFTGYLQWETWFEEKKEQEQNERKAVAQVAKAAEQKKKKLSFKEKFEYENMEAEISKLEETLSILQTESSKTEVVSNATKVQEVYKNLSETQSKLDKLYARWSELEERAKADS